MKSPGAEWYETSLDLTPFRPVWLFHWAQKQFLKDRQAKGGKLLDIGCGVGDFLFQAHNAGYAVTGIDFSPKFIGIARRRFAFENLYPLTLDRFIAQKPDNKYDVITFFEVMEHLDNIIDFLDSVKVLLKPGGCVACSVPNRERWRFLSPPEAWDYPPYHFTRWNPQALVNLFQSRGFCVLSVKTQPLPPLNMGWSDLVSAKLGIERAGMALARRLRAGSVDQAGVPQRSILGALTGTIAKLGVRLYVRAVLPFLGLVTLPLYLMLTRQGQEIYLLATVKE
jgi:ubiquinone/menaquinone biosynthesis C-methylase UbiE